MPSEEVHKIIVNEQVVQIEETISNSPHEIKTVVPQPMVSCY